MLLRDIRWWFNLGQFDPINPMIPLPKWRPLYNKRITRDFCLSPGRQWRVRWRAERCEAAARRWRSWRWCRTTPSSSCGSASPRAPSDARRWQSRNFSWKIKYFLFVKHTIKLVYYEQPWDQPILFIITGICYNQNLLQPRWLR